MLWLECIIDADDARIDSLCLLLSDAGVTGTITESESDFNTFFAENKKYWDYVDEELTARFKGLSRVKFYLPDDAEGEALLSEIKKLLTLSGYNADALRTAAIDDADWENAWKEFYTPVKTGRKLIVVPRWLDPDTEDRLPLRLDPGLIFGTGSHPTTRMCLEMLETYVKRGGSVLDLGCGSGILGIGALLLGASGVLGYDIDPIAPDIARRNAALNGFYPPKFDVLRGDVVADENIRRAILGGTDGGYSIALANIVADVIIALAPIVPTFLAEDGLLICSGIIGGRQDETRQALEANGFELTEHRELDGWHAFAAAKRRY